MKCTSLVIATLMTLYSNQVFAQSFKAGSIEVDRAWMRATPKGADSAAGYFRISNSGTAADRLTGGSTSVASRIEFHEMTMTDGVMRMRPLPAGLEIKPGESVEFKPSSFHAMLVGLKKPLKPGDHVKATLMFEMAGSLDVDYVVESIGAQGPSAGTDHGMGHMQMH